MEYVYKTRYLGSKNKLLEWIWHVLQPFIEKYRINSIADIFAGTHSVSYFLKRKGLRIVSNDFLSFNYYIGKSIIENNNVILNKSDIQFLLTKPQHNHHFIENEFTDLFFIKQDTIFLDQVYTQIQNIEDEYKRALAYSSITYAIIKKAPYGRFTTTTMSDTGSKSIKEYFLDGIEQYNNLVYPNEFENHTYHGDAIDVVKKINTDGLYIDPPYGGKNYSKYEHFYSFVETYINYWENEEMVGKLKQVKKRQSVFSHGKNHNMAFDQLFQNSVHIPLWIFSYNNNGGLSFEELKSKILVYKDNFEFFEVDYSYANKLSSYKEYLLIAY